jgi:hypothetical protein
MTRRATFRFRRLAVVLAVAVLAVAPGAGQGRDPVDLQALSVIKEEGLQRSKVMEIASYLTDVYGARLTASPNIRAAGDWTVKEMQGWGLSNVRLEPWGPFGRGWTNDRFVAHLVAPSVAPLIGYPRAWTPGTTGPVKSDAVLAMLANERDLETYRGKLKGKFVLTAQPRTISPQFDPQARRFTDAELADRARQNVTPPGRGGGPGGGGGPNFARQRMAFFVSEGVAATIEPGPGDLGTVFVQGNSGAANDPPSVPQIVLAAEHYNRLVRILEKKIPVTLEIDVANTFHDTPGNVFNVIGELPGTDRADEVVMLGAHFDSWHSGTGATDNAAGSAVMMEAMRILQATGLRLRRTVRIALWTGEEQGIFGSRAYVAEHFGDRQTMELKPEHAKLSGYFNVDNGSGAIRGVYLQGNDAIAPVFRAWMEPLETLGMTTLSIRGTGGTDHVAFDAVGLPGFQFIQDPLDYDSRTHHSNMDVYERLQAADMMKNAVIVAFFTYQAANRDTLLPRKPLPRPARPPASQTP